MDGKLTDDEQDVTSNRITSDSDRESLSIGYDNGNLEDKEVWKVCRTV